jgi:hypothetical protein
MREMQPAANGRATAALAHARTYPVLAS